MEKQFQEQGGAATMDPSAVLRWLTSRLMRHVNSPGRLQRTRKRAERGRIKAGGRHSVEYFHKVEDGYSHLAAQVLKKLAERYDVEFVCHLVSGPSGNNSPEPDLLLQLSRYDARKVASAYELVFPSHPESPDPVLVSLAESVLAKQGNTEFLEHVEAIGTALWSGDKAALFQYAEQWGHADTHLVQERIARGNERLRALKHYSSAMFYYGGEWYWGVDRLYHLERRFRDLGLDQNAAAPPLVPRPTEVGKQKDNGSLTLEFFPSLRSPYTAISFDRTVQLAQDTGVSLVVRPVLPMVMRGVPATRQKGMYIFFDTAREAAAADVPFGNFYDPIGDPVRKGYALYYWACEQGRGIEFFSAFLRCAFALGINLNRRKGLQQAVEMAGLDWSAAQHHVDDRSWEAALEVNRRAMYEAGLWGVPSFRLMDEEGKECLAIWGQDRLWLVAREIQRQLSARLN